MASLLDAADDDLAEWVDQGLEHFARVDDAQHTTPQIQTVHILPVIHGLIRLLHTRRSLQRKRSTPNVSRDSSYYIGLTFFFMFMAFRRWIAS